MTGATNEGVRERKGPWGRDEKVCARERSRHRENVFVRETPGRLLYVDGACRRELNEGMVLLVSGI